MAVALVDVLLLGAGLGLALARTSERTTDDPVGAARPELGVAPGGLATIPDTQEAGPLASGPTLPAGRAPKPPAGATSPSTGRAEVAARPWPARVTAAKAWEATMTGAGDRVSLTVPGTVVGGIGRATLDLGADDPRPSPSTTRPLSSNRVLILPDGAQWYPLGPVRLEGGGDLAFASASAQGSALALSTASLESVLRSGRGVTGVGTFVQPRGNEVARLGLPPGTRLVELCRPQESAGLAPCPNRDPLPLRVTVDAAPGLSVRAAGAGEVAVAGSVRAGALGRSWDALVGAVEAQQLRVTATYGDGRWTVTAEGGAARQLWVDVWPVVDTRLTARSVVRKPGVFDSFSLRIQWTNVGFADSQIFEAEGVGPGAPTVGFSLNKTVGHDAGVGVTRGDRVVNLAGGGDIDSNLAPGESVDRGLTATAGSGATVVLRGNFPEVRVPLATSGA